MEEERNSIQEGFESQVACDHFVAYVEACHCHEVFWVQEHQTQMSFESQVAWDHLVTYIETCARLQVIWVEEH